MLRDCKNSIDPLFVNELFFNCWYMNLSLRKEMGAREEADS